jgi:hypothetical protein
MFIGTSVSASALLVPRYVYQNTNAPTTATVRGFYKIKKNTTDVLVLGTSHFLNGLIPQEIYDESHIRSYNLASEQQSLFLSYYLLKEALRFQSPQAVVLDTKFVESFHDDYPINMGDELFRKVSDRMKLSSVKLEMINDYSRLNYSKEKLSYIIPVIRYHSRWSSLTKEDLEALTWEKHNELKGFYPLYHELISGYEPIIPEGNERTPMDPIMREYLEKITGLCREKGIKLILFRTPDKSTTVEIHNEIEAYADENGLVFYDLNDKRLYDTLKIKEPEETICEPDGGEHVNLPAAVKVSDFLAEKLEENGVTGMVDEQWEETAGYFQEILKDPAYVKRK